MFKIVRGRLKKVGHKWQKYLLDRKLILCTGLNNTLNLLDIEDIEIEFFYKYLWDNNYFVREDYCSYEVFIEDIKLGNYGVGFDVGEIEVMDTIKEVPLRQNWT